MSQSLCLVAFAPPTGWNLATWRTGRSPPSEVTISFTIPSTAPAERDVIACAWDGPAARSLSVAGGGGGARASWAGCGLAAQLKNGCGAVAHVVRAAFFVQKSAARFLAWRGARGVVFDRASRSAGRNMYETPQRTCEPVPIHACGPGARLNSNKMVSRSFGVRRSRTAVKTSKTTLDLASALHWSPGSLEE